MRHHKIFFSNLYTISSELLCIAFQVFTLRKMVIQEVIFYRIMTIAASVPLPLSKIAVLYNLAYGCRAVIFFI